MTATLSIVEVKTLEPTIHTVLLIGCGKKSQILWDFQRQIRGKIDQFGGNFAEIFVANFAIKQSVNDSRFCGNFLGKFC